MLWVSHCRRAWTVLRSCGGFPLLQENQKKNTDAELCSLELGNACRALRQVPGRAPASQGISSGMEARVLAAVGSFVVELAVTSDTASEAVPTLRPLKKILVAPSATISSISYRISPKVWARLAKHRAFPDSLLLEDDVQVVGGTCEGDLWFKQSSATSQTATRAIPISRDDEGSVPEVISVYMLSQRQLLAVSRTGIVRCFELAPDAGNSAVRLLWAKKGWRMYVSGIACRQPRLLVSDGFDNAMRTIRIRSVHEDDEDDLR
eukprot:gnl/TRDRNA2_/TRDRNA2_125361_c0_seq1.p3 gnl/TRDRNA2_/TRDRNA2_125361_c0~~gnl/TRDRNA2_/TRDRNA2_125361_c0_seq1.p3  ORF type:complete len:263 (-),score=36.54 gnl/TRDRNA2_/TRDRNA2_125361_c0_seq1:241-1029(-)